MRSTLEDSPFYSRSWLDSRVNGVDVSGVVHESLSLEQFSKWWVQALIPVRNPRALR